MTPFLRVSIPFLHQILFSFPRNVCSSEKFFARTRDVSFHLPNYHAHFLFTGLDDVLSRLEQVEQRPSRVNPRLGDATGTSGDESDMDEPQRRLGSKNTYKIKNLEG